MRRFFLMAMMALSLVGCATSTGIIPIAPGIYSVSEMRAPVLGGGAEARRVVLDEANYFCQSQALFFKPLDLRPDGDSRTPYYPTAFDATFQCVVPPKG